MKELLELRNEMKRNQPNFVRQEAHKRKKISRTGWRFPKGIHSKMKKENKSRRSLPAIGHSSPRLVRGLTREGLKSVVVSSINQLEKIKDKAVIVAKSVGLKKRISMLEKIKQLKLKVLNMKDIDGFIKKAKESLEARKKQKKEKQKAKGESKKEKPKEVKKETPEEKEKREKEEKRKVLEKK